MYERFTDGARRVMRLANQEAQRFNHEYIGTEHVLLGIVKEGSGTAAQVFANLHVGIGAIRLEIEKRLQSGPGMVPMGKLPMTPMAKRVVDHAIGEANGLGHNYVGTEHLLLGLLREKDSVAAQVLLALGLDGDVLRREIARIVPAPQETAVEAAEAMSVWTFITTQGAPEEVKLETASLGVQVLVRAELKRMLATWLESLEG